MTICSSKLSFVGFIAIVDAVTFSQLFFISDCMLIIYSLCRGALP